MVLIWVSITGKGKNYQRKTWKKSESRNEMAALIGEKLTWRWLESWFSSITALAGSIPSTHIGELTTTYSSSSGRVWCLWPPLASALTYTYQVCQGSTLEMHCSNNFLACCLLIFLVLAQRKQQYVRCWGDRECWGVLQALQLAKDTWHHSIAQWGICVTIKTGVTCTALCPIKLT